MIFDSAVRFASSCSRSASELTLFAPNRAVLGAALLGLFFSVAALAAPSPANDSATVNEDSVDNVINAAANDGPDAIPATALLVTQPSNGVAVEPAVPDGTFSYTPTADYFGPDSFIYEICDAIPECATATVNITVNGQPTADDQTGGQALETDEDVSLPIVLTGSDPEGSTLTYTIETQPSNGSLAGTPPNITYTPNAHFFGPDSLTFTVSDGQLTSAEATVSITVNAVNDAPQVVIDQPLNESTFDFGTLIQFEASATDVEDNDVALTNNIDWSSDLDGVLGKGGTASSSTLRVGTHVITAEVTDGGGSTGSASITIEILNTAPTAFGQSVGTGEDIPLPITLTGTDPEGSPLTFSIATPPASGSLSGTPPLVTYTPDADFNGSDSFTFTVSDGELTSLPATVSITVTAGNDAPTANGQSVTTAEDTPLPILLTGSDPEGSALTFAIATQPANGVLTGTSPSVTYTPNADFNGSDSFTFTVNDGDLDSAPATVNITVTPANDPPVAVNDTPPAIDEGSSINGTFNVLNNDTDPEDDALTAVLVAGPSNALNTFQLNANGTFVYDHDGSDTVTDSFSYRARDDSGELSNVATVTISINSVNDAPVAVNDGPFSVDEGASFDSGVISVLDNDTDSENDPLTATVVTPPANAAAFTLNTDGTFTYTHDGTETLADSFTYRANDGSPSNVATVTFTINPVNDRPTFLGVLPPGLSTPEDTTLTIRVSALDISDPDNVPADFVLTLDPVLPPDANYILAGPASVTPAENFNGDLAVRATVSDGELNSAPFLIPVTVTAENDPPVLEVEIGPQTAVENSLFQLNVFGNFSDADGDTLTFSATGLPASGSISIDPASGIISGTPTLEDARDNDPYIVTVTATDPATPENPAGTSVSDEFDLTVSALDRANIGLSIGVTPESGLPNDQLTWTFTAANPIGPAPGENVELTGSFFGDGLSVAAGSGASCSITLQTGRADFDCTIGALPVGSTASINFTTTASEATEVVAFGTAAGAQPVPIDPNISDNSAIRAVGVAESFSDGAVQFLGSATIRSAAAGDFNGDGRIDLVVGTAAGQPIQVFLGDEPRESCGCQRDFVTTPLSIPDTGANEGIAVADFDNDGNLDFVVANGGGQPDAVYHNTGSGNFAISALLAPSNGRGVAVGDFNNDGNIDIAIAATSPNSVYFGDGTGSFGAGTLLGDAESLDVAVGRFDDDAFLDLVFANAGSGSQVWLNTGGTGFAPGPALQIGDAVAVAAADLNNDNLDDLVFGRIPGSSGDVPSNPVLINQGGGSFGGEPQLLGISPTVDVLIGDVSDDGLPDLVFVNQSGVHQIWMANGGSFELHTEQIIDIGAGAGVLADLGFADTDDPGGADLVLGGALSAGAAVYLNDSSGNLGLGDAVAPIITLNGEVSVNVPSGTAYTDAGATAADNIDGDITSSIVVDNPVNSTVVGAYTVTYNVRDFAGNAAVQMTRTVNVTAATGRGGGGGGALGYWALALLIALQLLMLARARVS